MVERSVAEILTLEHADIDVFKNTHTVLSYKSFENRVDRLFEFPLRLFTSWQFNLPNYSFSSAMRLSGLKKGVVDYDRNGEVYWNKKNM